MPNWYVSQGNNPVGPYTFDQVLGMVRAGQVQANDYAIQEGSQSWTRVGDIDAFRQMPSAHAFQTPHWDVALAEPWTRFGARLLDTVFMFLAVVPGFVTAIVAGILQAPESPAIPALGAVGLLLVFGLPVVLTIFDWVLLAQTGQTLGKRIAGIRIVRAEDGEPVGFLRAVVLRNVVNSFLGMFSLGIYFLVDSLMIFNAERRCVHDMIAGTKVVRA